MMGLGQSKIPIHLCYSRLSLFSSFYGVALKIRIYIVPRVLSWGLYKVDPLRQQDLEEANI